MHYVTVYYLYGSDSPQTYLHEEINQWRNIVNHHDESDIFNGVVVGISGALFNIQSTKIGLVKTSIKTKPGRR